MGDLGLVQLMIELEGRWVDGHETAALLEPYGEWRFAERLHARRVQEGTDPPAERRADPQASRANPDLARLRVPSMARLAILGTGKIGESLLAGLLSSGWDDVVVTGRREERVAELRERYGVDATQSNTEAVAGAAIVVIAVKPQDFSALLGEIGLAVSTEHRPLDRSGDPDRADRGAPRRRCAGRARDAQRAVHRARGHRRPRRRCTRGRRAPAARRGRPLAPRPRRPPPRVGDGRRYGGVRLRPGVLRAPLGGDDRGGHPARPLARGLHTARDPDDARHGKLLRDENMHPVDLREAVTSPGGTTIRAIRVLEQEGVRAAFLNAIQAAMERSQELAAGGHSARARHRTRRGGRGLSRGPPGGAQGNVVLTGGTSPERAYELAADRRPDWSGTEL